jgi:sulfur-oxidizing protein SoxX
MLHQQETPMPDRKSSLRLVIAGLTTAALLTGCDTGPRSAQGFRLPDGDPEVGKGLFMALECNSCHSVAGMELEPPLQEGPVQVILGGPVARSKTYGQLVSSIINPSHKIVRKYPKEEVTADGESLMPIYNEMLTVQQLIDLVAFLQPQYEITLPQYTYYSYQY